MPRRSSREQESLFPTKVLYCGDNLDVLRLYQPSESVHLIYADPVFKPQASYGILFKEVSGRNASGQTQSFLSTWTWDDPTMQEFHSMVEEGPQDVSRALQAFRTLLGERTQGLAFLTTMATRLVEFHRVLKDTGSLYLHCDPAYSHYLRLLLDSVFGPDNFRTEIIWKRSAAHSDGKQGRRQHGRVHDVIFFYTKSSKWTWNTLYMPHDPAYIESHYSLVEPESGRRYQLTDITGPGGAAKGNPRYEVMGVTRYWRYSKASMQDLIEEGRIIQPRPGAVPRYKRFLDEMKGVPLQDIWTDVYPVNSQAAEREGYPTQKPVSLLKRIIETSSDPGDVVLDPYCGCGTTPEAAEELGRTWIGIDITHLAIDIIRDRLDKRPNPPEYMVKYEPVSVEDAQRLADEKDKSKFEEWALRRVGAERGQGKGADRGIDGRRYFHDEPNGPTHLIVVSVKAGNITPAHIRDLRGVIERDKADIGVLVSMKEPSIQMRREAAAAGNYVSVYRDLRVPKIQLLTVTQLLAGTTIHYPQEDRVPSFIEPGQPEPVEQAEELATDRASGYEGPRPKTPRRSRAADTPKGART